MKLEVFKPGWQQSVGCAPDGPLDPELVEEKDFRYFRLDLRDFHFSHAAALFLLQGASLRQLFENVVVTVGDRAPDFYSLAIAEPVKLHDAPPRISRLVLAHILERPPAITPDALLEQLFMRELAVRPQTF